MEKVYIKTKKGKIFECYVSEQMNKPIYYPVDSKTNGYIDYYDVERFLEIDSMYREVKQLQQEKEELIKWLEENIEKENNILKMSLTQESKVNSLTIIACFEQILSKLKGDDKDVS